MTGLLHLFIGIMLATSAALNAATSDGAQGQGQDQLKNPSATDQYFQQRYQEKVYSTHQDLHLTPKNMSLRQAQGGLVVPEQPTQGDVEGQEQQVQQSYLQQTQPNQNISEPQQKPRVAQLPAKPGVNQLQKLIQEQMEEQLQPAPSPKDRHPEFHTIVRASLLIDAIKQGNLEQVTRALHLGIDPNQRSREGETAVEAAIVAAWKGKQGLQMLRYLIRDGADLSALTSRGDTPLNMALRNGQMDVVALLVAQGVSLSAPGFQGYTPLEVAIMTGNSDAFHYLLDRKITLDTPNSNGDRPLNIALSYDQSDMAMELILAGVSVDTRSSSRITPLYQAAQSGFFDVVALLVQRGALVNLRAGPDLNTPLHLAALNNDLDSVKFLIKEGEADVNTPNRLGITPLMLAAGNPRTSLDLIKYLLSKGADLFAVDKAGDTALHAAAGTGNLSVVEELIRRRAPIDVTDKLGHTPIYMAALNARLETVKALFDHGAEVNTQPSALDGAIKGGDDLVIKYLIDNGAKM